MPVSRCELPALILAAGLGTRLRPLTDVRAKPAMPVGAEPLIRRTLAWLVAAGVSEIVVNLHHRPETITRIVGDGSDLSARVRYSWEQPRILGSAGGPRQALAILNAGRFVMMNGDTLADVDLAALADAHARAGAHVTMAVVPNLWPDRYGGVRLDGDGRVTGFAPRGRADGTYHFIGPQVVEAEVFRALPAGEPAATIGGLYDGWIARRPGSIRGFVCDTAFWDIGTVADYWTTCWAAAAREGTGDVIAGRAVAVSGTSRVSRSILWDRVEIPERVVLDQCIVTDDVRVPARSTYRRSVLVRAPDGALQSYPLLL